MWKCCQFQCCQFPIGDWEGILATATSGRGTNCPFVVNMWQAGELAGYGAGRIGLIYYSAKGKLRWRQNADIAVRRVTGTDARMAQTGFTSIVMTRSTVNGAVLQVTDMGARMARIGFTGMVRVATSVSGAARPQTARAAHTPLRTAMKSDVYGRQ